MSCRRPAQCDMWSTVLASPSIKDWGTFSLDEKGDILKNQRGVWFYPFGRIFRL
eukprot:SAG31_NODE_2523_length_5562_cov_4.427238_2_plen_54_part_00